MLLRPALECITSEAVRTTAAASEDADLSAFDGHDLHVVKSNETLTFEHTYTWWGNKRKLRVLAQPNVTLGWNHVPLHCRRARTVLLGPLMPSDIDCQGFVHKSRGMLIARKLQYRLKASGNLTLVSILFVNTEQQG